MANKPTHSSWDKLNNISYKIGLLVDLFSATHTKELFFSESGLAGLVITLSDIKEEIEAVSEATSPSRQAPPSLKRQATGEQ